MTSLAVNLFSVAGVSSSLPVGSQLLAMPIGRRLAQQVRVCSNECTDSDDGLCDDGGPRADYTICRYGTDCEDCGVRVPEETCTDECVDGLTPWTNDGVCDDGGANSDYASCLYGTDCTDCGSRDLSAAPTHPPFPPIASPTPPPFAPEPITCEILISDGTNLQDTGEWCNGRTTVDDCGTLNYVPVRNAYRQCGFNPQTWECKAMYGDLICPFPAPGSPPLLPPFQPPFLPPFQPPLLPPFSPDLLLWSPEPSPPPPPLPSSPSPDPPPPPSPSSPDPSPPPPPSPFSPPPSPPPFTPEISPPPPPTPWSPDPSPPPPPVLTPSRPVPTSPLPPIKQTRR